MSFKKITSMEDYERQDAKVAMERAEEEENRPAKKRKIVRIDLSELLNVIFLRTCVTL